MAKTREVPRTNGGDKLPKYAKTEEEKWQAESDVRTLAGAKEIMRDKKRHDRAVACAREKVADLKKITEGK